MKDSPFFASQRKQMLSEQIVARGIYQPRLLEALGKVPRHLFVPEEYLDSAYNDCPLPIGHGQTISQPYIVALMSELLKLKGDEIVLEVGTGSGYQAAVLAHLAAQVHTIERYAPLAERAKEALAALELSNVSVHTGDGSLGLPEFAPYQGILVTAAAPHVPQPLLEQLSQNGRLVLPVGGMGNQILQCWQRLGEGYDRDNVLPVAFVPLRGAHGWTEGH